MVNIGIVQMACTAKPKENLDKAIVKIREAASKGAQIICLQELFTSLYFCDVEDYENFKLAEAIPGPSTETLSAVAKELGVVIIASLFEKRTQGIYHNTTAVLDADGSYLGKYRKMHIPDDPAFYDRIIVLSLVVYLQIGLAVFNLESIDGIITLPNCKRTQLKRNLSRCQQRVFSFMTIFDVNIFEHDGQLRKTGEHGNIDLPDVYRGA